MDHPACILLVDDDTNLRFASSRLLRDAGYKVLDASTGGDGLQLACEQKPDLILLDVVLPDMDGLEVLRRIKADADLAHSHVVMLSDFRTGSDDQTSALEAGADAYLPRPISNRQFLTRVQSVLQLKQVEDVLREQAHQLGERVKELNCLYGISQLREQPDASLEEILQGTVELIPPAWQYPDIACARIILEEQEFKTSNFRETAWKQACELVVWGHPAGSVEVRYLEEPPEGDEWEYLPEERKLLNAIAERLGKIVERVRMEKALQHSEQELRIRNQINSIFLTYPDEEMYVEVLKLILGIMRSEYGTFGYFDEHGSFVAPALTRQIYWEQCNIPEKEIIFQKGTFGGIWGRAIEERRTLIANQGPFRMPQGHVPIKNSMVTPIIFHDQVISAIHVANKPLGYDKEDRAMVEMIAAKIAPVLYARLERDRRDRERKEAEEALRESEEKYRDLVENLNDVIYALDEHGSMVYISPAVESFLGFSPSEVIGRPYAELVFSEDLGRLGENLRRILAGHPLGPDEYRLVTKSGQIRWMRISSRPILARDRVVGVQGVLADITERKQAEQALHESQAQWRSLTENSPDNIVTLDPDLKIQYLNYASPGLTKEELLGTPLYTLVSEERQDEIKEILENVLKTGEPAHYETEYSTPDADTIHYESRVTPRIVHDRVVGLTLSARDITERKWAEEKLQWELAVDAALTTLYKPLISPHSSLEEIASTVLDQARSLTGSAHGYVSAIDPVTGDSVGYTLTEMLKGECKVSGEERRTVFPRSSDGHYAGLWGHSLNTSEAFYTNSAERHPASRGLPEAHIPLQQFLSVPVMLGEKLVGQIALANPGRDYTERDLEAIRHMGEFYALAIQRKRGEEALRESEEKYRDLVENVNDVIYELNADGMVTYVSPAVESLLGYCVSEVMGRHFGEFVLPDDGVDPRENSQKLVSGRPLGSNVYRALTKAGGIRWIRVSSQPRVVNSQVAGVRGVFTDVTDQVEAEQRLKAAVAEKETLLKEIHHRVKNNLQLISAMLALQARATGDERVTMAFEESQHRILSMAGIHEQLYRSRDLSQVDMATYIRDLTDELQHSYGRPTITIKAEAVDVRLDIDRAIPCGLIVNELVSNALKHAFPIDGQQAGEVWVTMRLLPAEEGEIELTVSDNGVGLRSPVDLEHTGTLGLTMVTLLSRQLGGMLEVDRNNGTTFRIRFSA
jgi:PAS domain S-box-containing protein